MRMAPAASCGSGLSQFALALLQSDPDSHLVRFSAFSRLCSAPIPSQFYRLLLEETWTERKWNGPRQFENSKSGSDLMMLPASVGGGGREALQSHAERGRREERQWSR